MLCIFPVNTINRLIRVMETQYAFYAVGISTINISFKMFRRQIINN